jgi:AbiTii
MTELLPLVRRLQLEAADSSKSVSDLLRLAKMAATKLDAKDALTWIDRELEGYSSIPAKDLPA